MVSVVPAYAQGTEMRDRTLAASCSAQSDLSLEGLLACSGVAAWSNQRRCEISLILKHSDRVDERVNCQCR